MVSKWIPFLFKKVETPIKNCIKNMKNISKEFVQTQIEHNSKKVINIKNAHKGGADSDLFKKIKDVYLNIDECTEILLELDELDVNINEDDCSQRELYLKQFYDINNNEERISTMIFLDDELNYLYNELRKLQKLLEPFFPKEIRWEEDEDDNGEVRGDEEVFLNKILYDDDINLDQLSENKLSDDECVIYNYYKLNDTTPTEIIISYTEILEENDSFFNLTYFQNIIKKIIKSKI